MTKPSRKFSEFCLFKAENMLKPSQKCPELSVAVIMSVIISEIGDGGDFIIFLSKMTGRHWQLHSDQFAKLQKLWAYYKMIYILNSEHFRLAALSNY